MRWCVIRHPELGAAIVAEDSLPVHGKRDWVRTSPLVDDRYSLNIADHPLPEPSDEPVTETPDGDTQPDSNTPTPTARNRARKTED